ncbi:hypothetical protein [Tenacibaculum sp. 190524A05c]|uniref:hypothetical protein n=1 Tax=Tenacibaculum platacis TaxID=3137852 RepID=UPI0031FA5893
MKKIILLLGVFTFTLISCSKEQSTIKEEEPGFDLNNLYGVWKKTEVYNGVPSTFTVIENGPTLTFLEDATFSTNEFPCGGTYTFTTDSIIKADFDCAGAMMDFHYNDDGDSAEILRYFGFEGAFDRYKKISDPE